MGAGIAKGIKAAFPEAYQADLDTPKGDKGKLGTYSCATVRSEGGSSLAIVNAYTQFHWRGRGIKADYLAIQRVFHQMAMDFTGKRIAYPMIGAGLAGGDWPTIANIIDLELKDEDHTVVEFSP